MPPDPQRRADTDSWLRKARKDVRCAEIDLAAVPPAPEDAVFHARQAIEKSLKAFLAWHDEPFPKTHDLGKLGNLAVGIDSTLETFVEQIVDLSKYAWLFRYPGDSAEPTPSEAAEVLQRARAMLELISIRVGDDLLSADSQPSTR